MSNDKYVFEVEDNPELAQAIADRLVTLGFVAPEESFNETDPPLNVTLGHYGPDRIHFGYCRADDSTLFGDHKLRELSDLYGAGKPSPRPEPEPEPVPELQLVVGGRYRDRSGNVFEITDEIGTEQYPFKGVCRQVGAGMFVGEKACYRSNGAFLSGPRGSSLDLIEEVYTPPTIYITAPRGARVEVEYEGD